jgi:hypothetical protein
MKTIGAAAILILAAGGAHAKDTQFWNLTSHTITALQLSPAGKSEWGPDQTVNDADHAVEHDERLKITGVATGVYDVKFTDKSGRNCVVAGVTVRQGAVFSIDEKKLKDCR